MRLIPYTALKDAKGIGYTRVHLARLIQAGRFPKPVNLGRNRIAWVEEEIDAWIRDRMAEREAA